MKIGSNNTEWTLLDSSTGAMRYDGVLPVDVEYLGIITCYSVGVTNDFLFKLMHNGTALSAPDNVEPKIGVDQYSRQAALMWSIRVDPGDVLKINFQNLDNTDDITFTDINVVIK